MTKLPLDSPLHTARKLIGKVVNMTFSGSTRDALCQSESRVYKLGSITITIYYRILWLLSGLDVTSLRPLPFHPARGTAQNILFSKG